MTSITHARVLRIAGPIMLANATIPAMGAVNTAVIGQLGQAAPMGAVGLGAVVLATLYWAFGFLRMSTSGLAAQAHGAGDDAERSAVLLRALLIGAAAGLALMLTQALLFRAAFAIAPASDAVESFARSYLSIRIWGAPATIMLYAVTGWLIALERTRAVLALQLLQNGLNVGLNLWFVLGLGHGVGGVASATLIAEWAGLGFGLWLCRAGFANLPGALARLLRPAPLRAMFQASRDIMGRSVLLQLSFTSFVFLGARFGDVTLAANHVLLQFLEITAYALDGLAFAAETLVGQAVGARALAEARRAGVISMQWGFAGAFALALIFALAGPALIALMTTAPEVRAEAMHYLPWLVAAPVIGIASWIFDGIFIGALLTREMLRAMLLSVSLYAVALLLLIPTLGNHGLWLALMLLNLTRAVTLWRALPALAKRMV